MAQTSLIESSGQALKVLELHAQDKGLGVIQRHLRKHGVELTDSGVWRWIDARLQEPKYREAYELAKRIEKQKLRQFFIDTLKDTSEQIKDLFQNELNTFRAMMETQQLSDKDAKTLESLDRMLHRSLDKIEKLAQMPEFAQGPSTQVNTQVNINDSSLRLMRLLQDVARYLPDDKRDWLMSELDDLREKPKPADYTVR